MAAKKSAPRRKRTAPVQSGAKKTKTVAAKKKHVRELAKACRWGEIKRLYGEKILAKAKTYAEKNRVVKTPQEIANEILLKNGYLPSVPQQAAATTPTVNRSMESRIRVDVPACNTTEAHSSPETLTKEQQDLIEKRRRDALERRKHTQQFPVTRVQSSVVPMDRVANAAKTFQGGLQSTNTPVSVLRHRHLQPPPPQRMESTIMQPCDQTRRIVTPEHPTTNSIVEAEHVRPEYFWDDLEAAAEIVQWEHEHMAEAALEQVPTKAPRGFDGASNTIQQTSGRQTLYYEGNTRSHGISSLSQELAAAAEIIQWENEHEISPEAPASRNRCHPSITVESSDTDPELDTPQFQLISAHIPIDQRNAPSNQAKVKSHRKRPLVAAPPPALPHRNAEFNGNRPCAASSCPAQAKRDPTAEFIDKHILEDKLELPVLEFLDMMLS